MEMFEEPKTQFSWTIDGFDMCPLSRGRSLESKIFSIDHSTTTKFSLQLYPRGHEDNKDDNYLSLYIKSHNDDGDHGIYVRFEVGLGSANRNCTTLKTSGHLFTKNSSKGFKKFLVRNLLLNSQKGISPRNKLTVFFRILSQVSKTRDESLVKHEDRRQILEELSKDFANLFSTGIHSDMTILVGEEKYRVHKVILQHRCPALLAQLKLKHGNVYFLPGVNETTLIWPVLYYSYTGRTFDTVMLEKLVKATLTFGLTDLHASLFPKPIVIHSTTKVNFSQVTFELDTEELTSNTEMSHLVFSDEIPDWSWLKISLLKISRRSCMYEMRFQRLFKSEITFFKGEVKYFSQNKWIILKEFEHLFETGDECIMRVYMNTSYAKMLYFEIRTSIGNGECREVDTSIKLTWDSFPYVNDWKIFQKDMRNLYEKMEFADSILCNGNEKLPVHKAILSSRSIIIEKMFENGAVEKVIETDIATMKSLSRYIYCGDVDDFLTPGELLKRYVAAEKYQLLQLRGIYSRRLGRIISAWNVGAMIVHANLHNDETLKSCAFDYIKSHPKEIISSTGLDALRSSCNVDLYHEILNMILIHMAGSK